MLGIIFHCNPSNFFSQVCGRRGSALERKIPQNYDSKECRGGTTQAGAFSSFLNFLEQGRSLLVPIGSNSQALQIPSFSPQTISRCSRTEAK